MNILWPLLVIRRKINTKILIGNPEGNVAMRKIKRR